VSAAEPEVPVTRPPNILILMADQLTPRALSAYGGRVAKTPTIDRLAREGVVFENAYCNSPLCAPSRYAMMSGQMPSATGGYDNAAEFAADTPTFAHYLRAAGYLTLLAGKMHFCGADQLHGFEERLTTDIYPADFGWTPDWSRPGERLDWYHNMDSVTRAGPCVRTNQLDFDEAVIFAARQKLFDLARSGGGRPFCMVVSLTHPHDPFTIPEPWWSRHADEDIDAPRNPAGTTPDDPHSRRLRQVIGLDDQPVSDEQIHAARRAYYGACAFVDDGFGAVLQALAAARLAEDTIVLVVADHGEMLGERGLWYKMSFFDPACRIPMIVHAPGRFAPRRVEASVSLVDLLPTLLDLAGAEPVLAAPIAGRSLTPHLLGGSGPDGVIGEYLAEGAVAPIVMLREGRWKFVHSPSDPDQLYDLDADPEERRNLAAEPSHGVIVAEFRARVAELWDLAHLHQQVLASQRRRRLVGRALDQGHRRSWDFQPWRDASELYIRNTTKLDDLEAAARFP
jgi:choline-sulfatase